MKINKRKCLVCEREFEYSETPVHNTNTRNLRSKHCVTCSKECSRVYDRVARYLRVKYVKQNKCSSN